LNDIVKPGFALLAITVIAAFLLGGVYAVTKDTIYKNDCAAKCEAMTHVLHTADDFPEEGKTETGNKTGIISYSKGYGGGVFVGYAIEAAVVGYGGDIVLLVGIGPDGAVTGVDIVSHSETPGLGAKAGEDGFREQYIGKTDIIHEYDAISSATVTSDAVTGGVNMALEFYADNLKEGVD